MACHLATARGKRYPMFNRSAHSADTLLPIVPLEMQLSTKRRAAVTPKACHKRLAHLRCDPGRRSPGAFGLIPGGVDAGRWTRGGQRG